MISLGRRYGRRLEFRSLTRIRENPQCPCFRRLNTRYPPINQDRSSDRRRRGAPLSSLPREPSDIVWHPVYSHSTHVRGTPGVHGERPLEELLGRGVEFVEQLVAVTTTSVLRRIERQPHRYIASPERRLSCIPVLR